MNHPISTIAIFAAGVWLGAGIPLRAQTTAAPHAAPATLAVLSTQEVPLGSGNAAWLHTLHTVGSLSEASLWGGYQEGGLHDYHGSGSLTGFGADAASYMRLSPRVVVGGGMAYRYEQGREMGGSVLMSPDEAPFDLVELTDENRGDKVRETYRLEGTFAYALNRRFHIGAGIDYTAANYAKRKDLRHVNKLMDMNLHVGATYRLAERLTIGADYRYRRRTEGILFSMYGTTDKVYNTLVDYGGFFGKSEQFGDNGYTSASEEKPLFDQYHTVGLQLRWQPSARWELFAESSYSSRAGYYGKESPSTVVYSRHDGSRYEGALTARYRRQQASAPSGTGLRQHLLRLAFSRRTVSNRESIYRYVNQGGGLNTVEYYGSLDMGSKALSTATAHYVLQSGWQQGRPVWQLDASPIYDRRQLTASVYPYYRKQDLHRTAALLKGRRQWGRWGTELSAAYSAGGGGMAADGVYATPSGSQEAPASMPLYLSRAYEYFTARQWQTGIALDYEQPLMSGRVRGFAALRYDYRRAVEASYLTGTRRHALLASLGCRF